MKYRLKKWYPSLNPRLKEGAIFKETKKNRIRGEDRGYVHDDGICPYFVSAHEVENNREYWEPINETYVVCTENGYGYGTWTVFRTNREFDNKRFFKHFETKEKAQEYIDNHKPKYSKADIKEATKIARVLYGCPKFDKKVKEILNI